MITDEQVISAIAEFYKSGTGNCGMRRVLEAYEQSKPKPEPVGYTLDVLKEYFYAGFMSSGEGFNGEWGGMKSCDIAWEEYSATQNKLQEANKPKPEPVTPDVYSNDGGEYWVQHPADCDIFSDWDDEPKVGDEYGLQVCWTGKQIFRITEIEDGSVKKVELIESDKAYYTTPPTREPLTKEQRGAILKALSNRNDGYNVDDVIDETEKAHGIGVTNA